MTYVGIKIGVFRPKKTETINLHWWYNSYLDKSTDVSRNVGIGINKKVLLYKICRSLNLRF